MKYYRKYQWKSLLALATRLLAMMVFLPQAQAFNSEDNIAFSVTGNIINGSCNVEAPTAIKLGMAYRGDLAVAGANSVNVPFTLTLTDCAPGLSEATAIFSGTPYNDPAYKDAIYANDVANGAQGLGLQIFNYDGRPLVNLANGVSYVFPVDSQTNSSQLRLIARMYSPYGTTTSGDFSSTVTINFTYK